MKILKLELSDKEIEIIFKALGQRPFLEVYELIGKINEQVNAQYDPKEVKLENPDNVNENK